MVDESSIGPWLRGLRDGEAEAMREIWDRFFQSLVKSAEQRLSPEQKKLGDGEDIAVSVFESLWRGYQEGRFQDVSNRSELWWTLLRMARRKVVDHIRRNNAAKRGGETQTHSLDRQCKNGKEFYELLVSEVADPQYVAALEEEYHRAISILDDARQRKIAALTIEGYSTTEISEKIGLSTSSVRRKLRIVQETWKLEATNEWADER